MGEKQMMIEEEEIVIVGGGIAGLATAVALKRVGFHSRVLESHSVLRTTGAALTLAPNAWFALRALGVDHKLTSVYQSFNKSVVTNLETGVRQEVNNMTGKNDRTGVGLRSVHRTALLQALAEELPPDTIRFSSKLISIKTETQQDSPKITALHLADGTIIKAKVVIGCDGVHSAVAQWLGLSQPINSGRSAVRGLSIFPEGHGFKQEVRVYLGRGIRAGFVPLHSKELYWFFIDDSSSLGKDISINPDIILKEVTENLAKDFPSDYLMVAKHADLSTLSWAPLLFRVPWNVAFGRAQNGNVTVAGDAFHPMNPDLGQGGCSSLEDAVVLARCLSQAQKVADGGQQWQEEGLKRYVEERRWRVTWIAAGSWFSGWSQKGGGNGENFLSNALRWFRDRIFYKFVFPRLTESVWFDCGDLNADK
ncbi:hypothetical protein LUZ60_004192 [Juncus effusus]|nr:hypothetical protein LUZ60_004192 [Juncus effusus]